VLFSLINFQLATLKFVIYNCFGLEFQTDSIAYSDGISLSIKFYTEKLSRNKYIVSEFQSSKENKDTGFSILDSEISSIQYQASSIVFH